MTEPNPKTDPEDELAGTEQPFVAHLMELRDRLIKALVAVGVVAGVLALVIGVVGGGAGVYHLLGARDGATSTTSPPMMSIPATPRRICMPARRGFSCLKPPGAATASMISAKAA